MRREAETLDPEVEALVKEVRALVGQAYQLSQQIQTAMTDLDRYVEQVQPGRTADR